MELFEAMHGATFPEKKWKQKGSPFPIEKPSGLANGHNRSQELCSDRIACTEATVQATACFCAC